MTIEPLCFVEFGTADGYTMLIPNHEIFTLSFFNISSHIMYINGLLQKCYSCDGYEIKMQKDIKHKVCKDMEFIEAQTFDEFAKKHKVCNATVTFANTTEWLMLIPQPKQPISTVFEQDNSILFSYNSLASNA